MRLLIVTAVPAERDAVIAGLSRNPRASSWSTEVVAVGVGPAAAAAATARLIALAEARGAAFDAVLSAGIAGGFVGRVEVGDVVLATRSVAADVGAESPNGFLPLPALHLPSVPTPPWLAGTVADQVTATVPLECPLAHRGAILTLATVTGTAVTAATLAERHPDALAEAMEGFGVAAAAVQAGLRFGEVRTISNPIGPRDRSTWRLEHALSMLTSAFSTVSLNSSEEGI